MSVGFTRNAALYLSDLHCVPGPLTLSASGLEFANHTLAGTHRAGVLRIPFADVGGVEVSRRRWPHLFRRCLLVHLRDGTTLRIWVAEVLDSHAQVAAALDAWTSSSEP